MQLGFFKIFALCRDNKRLFNIDNPTRTIGIYDAKRYTFKEANKLAKAMHSRVSVLLGNVVGDTKLICLDLDDCYLDNGAMESETKEFIKEFRDDEWENSNSGTGIHIYILRIFLHKQLCLLQLFLIFYCLMKILNYLFLLLRPLPLLPLLPLLVFS